MTPEIERYTIIALATLSGLMFAFRGQWENVITRLLLATLYVLTLFDFIKSQNSMFVIRWALILVFIVELLRYGLEKLFRILRQ